MRNFIFSSRVLFVALMLSMALELQAAEPHMRTPESLDQGFILLVTDQSGIANADSPIYLASSHNGWNPGDEEYQLTPRSDGRWQIILPKPKFDSRMGFKFTRGSWDTVEVDSEFNDIENRLLPKVNVSKLDPGKKPVIKLRIEAWADQRPDQPARPSTDRYRTIEVEGTLRRVEVQGGGVTIMRDVLVWLPPGYEEKSNDEKRYPVLYLMDGQNLFENLPTIPGEWEVDETATRLIRHRRIEPIIIVGIPSLPEHRATEYIPSSLMEDETSGEVFVDFLVHEVKPRIDRAFRTRTQPEYTAIGGSSLGAVISLYAAINRPDVYGKVLAESPALIRNNGPTMQMVSQAIHFPQRVYIGMGRQENGKERDKRALNREHIQAARQMKKIIHKRDSNIDVKLHITKGTHNELAWAKRLPRALQYLFPYHR